MARTEINHSQRRMRIETFRFLTASLPNPTPAQSTAGVPDGAYRCTAAKTATGTIQVIFNQPFTRVPIVTATAFHASAKIFVKLSAISVSGATFVCYIDDGTATDPTQLHVTCIGADTADQQG